MIFVETLHAKQKRVVFENNSIVRRNACWAALVILSASSNITILCLWPKRTRKNTNKSIKSVRDPLLERCGDGQGRPTRRQAATPKQRGPQTQQTSPPTIQQRNAPTGRQGHLVHGEALDAVADHLSNDKRPPKASCLDRRKHRQARFRRVQSTTL